MTPKGTLRLWCIYMAQLITHAVFVLELLTLQLCYKPLGILQRVKGWIYLNYQKRILKHVWSLK